MNKKLYREREGKILGGVCVGIGNFFSLDPTLIRLAWILFSCLGGSGILAYILCLIIIPPRPERYY